MIELGSPWALVLLLPVLLLPLQPWLTGRNRLAVAGIAAMSDGWTIRRLLAPLPRLLQVVGLALLVEATGGRYFRATDSESLAGIYDTINTLEPSPAEVVALVDWEERFRWLLIPGLAMLGIQVLLSATWLRRGP